MIAITSVDLINMLQEICGKVNVFSDDDVLNHYGHDETEKIVISAGCSS
jgi:hypothetical protein